MHHLLEECLKADKVLSLAKHHTEASIWVVMKTDLCLQCVYMLNNG